RTPAHDEEQHLGLLLSARQSRLRSAAEISGTGMRAVTPPSTGITAPVTNAAASDARNSAAFAMSSGMPRRVRCIALVAPPMTGSSIIFHAPSLVSTIPDTMQF